MTMIQEVTINPESKTTKDMFDRIFIVEKKIGAEWELIDVADTYVQAINLAAGEIFWRITAEEREAWTR